jgi:hypothetical protein
VIEGSGSMTSGSGFRRPKNMRIIRLQNLKTVFLYFKDNGKIWDNTPGWGSESVVSSSGASRCWCRRASPIKTTIFLAKCHKLCINIQTETNGLEIEWWSRQRRCTVWRDYSLFMPVLQLRIHEILAGSGSGSAYTYLRLMYIEEEPWGMVY